MPIFEMTSDELKRIEETTFSAAGKRERADLQRLLRKQIDIVVPDVLVITEEFGDWDDSRRRIDLLGIDKDANLVVIELKRTEDGGHMEMQALRYAAMVSTMTFDEAVTVYGDYLRRSGQDNDPQQYILDFLEWDELNEEHFAQDIRIILVSAEFSKELTSSVLWLNSYGLDIRCVRIKPYNDNGRTLIDVQQVIPLPESIEYQVRVDVKTRRERIARTSTKDLTKYDVSVYNIHDMRMAKRNAIFHIVRNLCSRGTKPNQIKELISWRPRGLFFELEGQLSSSDFIKLASAQRENNGRAFDEDAWFYKDKELIYADGMTYAFTNRWGKRWRQAMDLLTNKFPEANIEYCASQ